MISLLYLSCILPPPPSACQSIEVTNPPYTPLNIVIAVCNVIQWSTVIVLPTVQVSYCNGHVGRAGSLSSLHPGHHHPATITYPSPPLQGCQSDKSMSETKKARTGDSHASLHLLGHTPGDLGLIPSLYPIHQIYCKLVQLSDVTFSQSEDFLATLFPRPSWWEFRSISSTSWCSCLYWGHSLELYISPWNGSELLFLYFVVYVWYVVPLHLCM